MGSDSPFSATPSGQTQKVGPASPKRLDTLGRLGLVIVTLGFIVTAGCSTNIIDQATSLLGTRTEELRDWVREDQQRDKLIVFVHGFNSNKEEAWGQFPALLKDDADFMDFNIHRFGYPTKLCRQVSDIRNEGEFLASFLTSTLQRVQPKYRQVVLVGHSMGGLVILHALLNLQRDYEQLLRDQDLKVLTFGTPYHGVENTDVLELCFKNKQVNDMRVLNDKLGELAREWTQRFNQKQVSGGRDTPQVPLYAFRGTEDRFVSKTSACGYPQTPCEPVDGDHNSIVKPKDQTHLAYQKLKQLATQPKVPRTATGKIGIWVARLTGDDPSHAAQRDIARRLEHVISQGEPQLHEAVEIRELPTDIEGNTLKEKEAEAKRLGQYEQASIVVWGDVTGSVMHLRVTLVKPLGLTTKTVIIAPRSHASELPQLSTPPETVHMLPQSVKEPLQLARFVLALTFMEQQAWAKAAEQLEYYIGATPSTAVRLGDVYFYAGFIHFSVFSTSGMSEPLATARDMCEKAAADYQREKNWAAYAMVQNNLGVIYRVLAQRGVQPEENLRDSVEVLTEAARQYKEQQSWAEYAGILNNLGLTYRVLAERGVLPEENLQHSVVALREAASLRKKQENWAAYAMVQINLGVTYWVLAQRGVAPGENLRLANQAFKEASAHGQDE